VTAPRIHSVDPTYGPVKPGYDSYILLVGENFICDDEACPDALCRLQQNDIKIYEPAEVQSHDLIQCLVP